MPRTDFPQFDRFLRGVHRRFKLLRLIESVGFCVAIAAALALPLILLLAWRGAPATEATTLILALGAVAGVGWALTHGITPLQAAMEADRQLGLADLLGSALLLRQDGGDPWKAAVLADAEARCRGVSPSAVLARRLSSRAWSGISLAIGLALTISACIGGSSQTLAQPLIAVSQPPSIARNDSRPLLEPIAPSARPSAAPREGEDAPDASASESSKITGGLEPSPSQSPSGDNPGVAADGQGGTLSRSAALQPHAAQPRQAVSAARPSVAWGHLAGGHADAADSAGAGAAAGVVAPGSDHLPPATPWTSTGWAADVASAQRQIDNGHVPAPYRDLVREYFRRD